MDRLKRHDGPMMALPWSAGRQLGKHGITTSLHGMSASVRWTGFHRNALLPGGVGVYYSRAEYVLA